MKRRRSEPFVCLAILVLSFVAAMAVAIRTCDAEGIAPPVIPGGQSSAGEGEPALTGAGTPDDYVIQVDDILMIDDGKQRTELSRNRTYRVAKDGTVKLVYLQRVQAAGMTKRDLEDKIEKLYDPKYFKDLSITIEVASKTYNIGGEIRSPGIKPLLPRTTILTAIASGGWFTDFAKESKVVITRTEEGKTVQHVIDCNEILRGKGQADFLIKPNDVIFVPRSPF